MSILRKVQCLWWLLILNLLPVAIASHINIGIYAKPSSLDPHRDHVLPNWTVLANSFQLLRVVEGEIERSGALRSGFKLSSQNIALIEKYEAFSQQRIHLHLRQDARFHDGSLLTVDDVIYSIKRIRDLSDSGFKQAIAGVVDLKKVSDFVLALHIDQDMQNVTHNLRDVFVIKKDSGEQPMGSGPYEIQAATDNLERIDLVKSAKASEVAQPLDVTSASYIFVKDRVARVQQLIDGKLDMLEHMHIEDKWLVLGVMPKVNVAEINSSALHYLGLDQQRQRSPFIYDHNGQALPNNPFMDKQVRKAISLAIDREGLTQKTLSGGGAPTGQFLNENQPLYLKKFPVPPVSLTQAKLLMHEAGYAQGFRVVLHTTEDKLIVAEALVKMLGKINISVVPYVPEERKQYFAEKNSFKYSLSLNAWRSVEANSYLKNLLHSYQADSRLGRYNAGRYSNPRLDALVSALEQAKSRQEQYALSRQGMMMALQDDAIIPLYHQVDIWLSRPPYQFNANAGNPRTVLSNIEKVE